MKLMNVVVFDLETTGVDTNNDRIVEIYLEKISDKYPPVSFYCKVNPGFHIPESASAVHGIYDDDVADAPSFKDIANDLYSFIDGCDLAGFNSIHFDVPMLYNEFLRAGIVLDYSKIRLIDACNIFRQKEAHTLSKAVSFYLDKDHTDAHSAVADVVATKNVLLKQIEMYGLNSLDEIALLSNWNRELLDLSGKFTYNDDKEIVFTFGQHKDKVAKNHPDYLSWMLKGNFNHDTKRIANELLKSI